MNSFPFITKHHIWFSLRIVNILSEFFLFLSDSTHYSNTPVQIGSNAEYDLFTNIESLMEEHNGRISRSELSRKLNYSGAYLNEITKKYTGMSLFDFGMTFCMKKAAHLLKISDTNVMDICLALGFQNRSHFYSIFKKNYGMTPAEYRKKQKHL